LNRAPEIVTKALYVAGGLYGNLAALDALERMAEAERATIVLNGDFHWFDADPEWFAAIEARVKRHAALRGNVETEVARAADAGAGCGCAYPASVDQGVVRRSNDILRELRAVAPPNARARLARLPMHLVAQVGGLRVGIVHGDAESLAGWRFAHDQLDDPARRLWLAGVARQSQIDIFASTHTCLAALRDFTLGDRRLTAINNGAAGMPNFAASTFGVITRIATRPSPHRTLYGMQRGGVHIDALAVEYDQQAFLERFRARWPTDSAACLSYSERIMRGPDHAIATAAR
jgi:predicted phosphodiesterase